MNLDPEAAMVAGVVGLNAIWSCAALETARRGRTWLLEARKPVLDEALPGQSGVASAASIVIDRLRVGVA